MSSHFWREPKVTRAKMTCRRELARENLGTSIVDAAKVMLTNDNNCGSCLHFHSKREGTIMPCYSSVLLVALVLATVTQSHAFVSFPPRQSHQPLSQSFRGTTLPTHSFQSRLSSRLYMSIDSDDPFVVLNLNPTADKKEIKRAYKRMALKSHPDVVCNSESTPEERRNANDDFAKINWAYEQLSGKNGASTTASRSSTSSSSYTPPHRRTTSPYTTRNTASTDWRDYIPNYQKEEQAYNTDGDSFSKIFSDLIGGVAAGAAGGGGIFRDFVEFLEDNIDGYTDDMGSDGDLYTLLNTGTVKEVAMEMDDTELVVQSLESKKKNVADELLMKTADKKFADKFSERVELEERIAELEARKKVVDGYLSKARKRLLSLQARYKELIVGGADVGSSYSSSPRTTGYGDRGSSSPYSSSSRSSTYSSSSRDSASSSSGGRRASTSTSSTTDDDNEWKHQGFGSSGRRGRGSSRRGRSRWGTGAAEEQQRSRQTSSSYDTTPPPPPPRQETSSASTYNTTPSRSTSTTRQSLEDWKPPVPPHRRTTSEPSQAQKDKKRLRELQVDDEFDKLKKELGL